MLKSLSIKNFAIIDHTVVEFGPGLNIISGETGAGKSIIIQAISLLLGGRSNADFIRKGMDEATVEGFFDLKNLDWIKERLDENGIEHADNELLIKRVISDKGQNKIYINGQLSTLSILKKICDDLIDLCGQHEHQSLVKMQTQMEMIDRFGKIEKEAQSIKKEFKSYKTIKNQIEEITSSTEERLRKLDFLNFEINKIESAELKEDEDKILHQEKAFLQSSKQRVTEAHEAKELLSSVNEEKDILSLLAHVKLKLEILLKLDEEKTRPLLNSVQSSLAELEEVSFQLEQYLEDQEINPGRLEEVQERLSLIAELRRKYGSSVKEMIETLEALKLEREALENTESQLETLTLEIEKLKKELLVLGKQTHLKREKVTQVLSRGITQELEELNMQDAAMEIKLSYQKEFDQWNSQFGPTEAEFLIQTNKGEDRKPLSKIASGGELSRITLAIRKILGDSGKIGVYLFDEIDAGIGGKTAFQVGSKLKSVASHNQVICITHLPQVASFADFHYSVIKKKNQTRTVTEIKKLDTKDQKEEIARMLGGDQLTQKSIENAEELLNLAVGLTRKPKASRSPARRSKVSRR